MLKHTINAFSFFVAALGRDIVFPPASPVGHQLPLGSVEVHNVASFRAIQDMDDRPFTGLTTYANLPYVHCLAPKSKEIEPFDIAILGAPFDTVRDILAFDCMFRLAHYNS